MQTRPRSSNTILVIDDDPETREVLELAVSMEGYSVRVAEDTETALEIVAASPPAMVLLDYYGVGEDAGRVVASVRAAGGAIPIVLMTGAKDPAGKAKELGLKRFLQKPFDFHTLRKLLRSHAGIPKAPMCAGSPQRSLNFSLFS